jgi:hypothetical protein
MENRNDNVEVAGCPAPVCSASTDLPRSSRPAMDWHDRHSSFPPSLILDVDNGVDFTFEGMGLKGNRPDPEPVNPEAERLKAAIRSFVTDFERISWGFDGDCGSAVLVDQLFSQIEPNTKIADR